MAEYIEREATLNVLRNLGSRDYRREKGTIMDAMKMIMNSHYTPSADVAEIKHGKWLDNHNSTFTCSVCGRKASKMDYCGNCGARMDGDGVTVLNEELFEKLKKTIDNISDTTQKKLSKEEFYDKFCSGCGSQRCEGIGTVWFDGCIYKKFLKEEDK